MSFEFQKRKHIVTLLLQECSSGDLSPNYFAVLNFGVKSLPWANVADEEIRHVGFITLCYYKNLQSSNFWNVHFSQILILHGIYIFDIKE